MRRNHSRRGHRGVLLLAFAILVLGSQREGRADRVIMKNGLVYVSQGTPDKDNSLVYIWDGLKRVVVRDSKVEKIVPDNDYRTGERFQLVQPMMVHAGSMPKEVISVRGQTVGRPRPSGLPLPRLEVEPDTPDGAGDHRDRPAHRPVSRDRRVLGGRRRDQPGAARGDHVADRAGRPAERGGARARGPVPDGRRLVSRGPRGARSADPGLPQDRAERARGQRPGLHHAGRGHAAPLRGRPAAAGAAIPGGGPAAEDVQGQGDRHRSSRSRSARSSGATSSSRPRTGPWRSSCASWPAG